MVVSHKHCRDDRLYHRGVRERELAQLHGFPQLTAEKEQALCYVLWTLEARRLLFPQMREEAQAPAGAAFAE